jgi:hypothetical protein
MAEWQRPFSEYFKHSNGLGNCVVRKSSHSQLTYHLYFRNRNSAIALRATPLLTGRRHRSMRSRVVGVDGGLNPRKSGDQSN